MAKMMTFFFVRIWSEKHYVIDAKFSFGVTKVAFKLRFFLNLILRTNQISLFYKMSQILKKKRVSNQIYCQEMSKMYCQKMGEMHCV
jgi:hypothetical protein